MKKVRITLAVVFMMALAFTVSAQDGGERQRPELTEEQKAMRETIKAKKDAYHTTLSDVEKTELEALKAKRKEGGKGSLSEAERATVKKHKDAFLATLTTTEKEAAEKMHARRKGKCKKGEGECTKGERKCTKPVKEATE